MIASLKRSLTNQEAKQYVWALIDDEWEARIEIEYMKNCLRAEKFNIRV
jgi:hypothetical protein